MKGTIYTHDEASRIIEFFEEVLEQNGIIVPSPEDDEREADNCATLYGSVYSDLLDEVEGALIEMLKRANVTDVVSYEYSGTC